MSRVHDRSPPKARRMAVLALSILAAFGAGATLSAQAQKTPTAQVIEDEAGGAVRILIDGRDVVTIDASGLHVSGDIDYTGVIADKGGTR